MKLFLRLQVEERALEIWGDEEALEKEHEKREQKRDQAKVKKFNKKLKALRMQVRGSLYKKDISNHEHEYGEEVYDEDKDEYSRTCKTCDHVHSYEKMWFPYKSSVFSTTAFYNSQFLFPNLPNCKYDIHFYELCSSTFNAYVKSW